VTNEDATFVKVVVGKPVGWGLTCPVISDCCWGGVTLFASSKSVGARGTGGSDGALGTPNGLREPVWCALRGWSGGDVGFTGARGVDAGRVGTDTGVGASKVEVCTLKRFIEAGWPGEAEEKGCGTVCDDVGNGLKFVEGEDWFGPVALGTELFVRAVNGFMFPTVGNGFIVCPAPGNGFVLEFVIGKGFVPRKPCWGENGLWPVGGGFIWPNGESPVACMGRVLARKGFGPVACD